ncbi:MAG: hypothetical protein AAGK66_02255, partial [Pseudomonadota bacterium]
IGNPLRLARPKGVSARQNKTAQGWEQNMTLPCCEKSIHPVSAHFAKSDAGQKSVSCTEERQDDESRRPSRLPFHHGRDD